MKKLNTQVPALQTIRLLREPIGNPGEHLLVPHFQSCGETTGQEACDHRERSVQESRCTAYQHQHGTAGQNPIAEGRECVVQRSHRKPYESG